MMAIRRGERSELSGVLVLLLALGMAAACVGGVLRPSLWGPTEPREIEIAREQFVARDLLRVPTFAGMPFLEKPPLYTDLVASAFALAGGASVASARVVTALFALAWMAAVVLVMRRAAGLRAALLAGCLLAANPLFLRLTRRIDLDVALATFLTLALAFFHLASSTRGPLRAWPWRACMGMAGLAAVTKGVLALAIFVAPALAYALWMRDRRIVSGLVRPLPLLLLLGPLTSWGVDLYLAGGMPYVFEHFVNNSLGRFLHVQFPLPEGAVLPYSDVGGASPPWYYLQMLPVLAGAGLPFLAWELAAIWRRPPRPGAARSRLAAAALCWGVIPPLLLTFSAQKGIQHLGSCASGLVLLSALGLDRLLRACRRAPTTLRLRRLMAASALAPSIALAASFTGLLDTTASLGAMGALAIGLAASGVVLAWRSGSWRAGAWCVGSLALALAVLSNAPRAHRDSDARRDLQPFARRVAALVGNARVGVHRYGDHELGSFSFGLGRNIEPLHSCAAVDRFLSAPEPAYCVIEVPYDENDHSVVRDEAHRELWSEIASGGNASHRYVLLANAAALGARDAPDESDEGR